MTSIQNLSQRVAGSADRVGISGDWHAQAERISKMTYDDWLRDKVVYGTPEAVVDRLHQLVEELQLDQIVYEINFGRRIPYQLQMDNLRLLTERVLPEFK